MAKKGAERLPVDRWTGATDLQTAQRKYFHNSGVAARSFQNIRSLIEAYPDSLLAHSYVLEHLHQLAEDIVLVYEDSKEEILEARKRKAK